MKKKEDILGTVPETSSSYEKILLEVLVDIRDILCVLSSKIPLVIRAGMPSSPPPPEVR